MTIVLHEIIPCAEDRGATSILHGEIVGLKFSALGETRGQWVPILFVSNHCSVFRRDRSVLVVSCDGTFSFSRLRNEQDGLALLNDFVETYSS